MGVDTIETILIYPDLYKVRYNESKKEIISVYGWGGAKVGPDVIEKIKAKLF